MASETAGASMAGDIRSPSLRQRLSRLPLSFLVGAFLVALFVVVGFVSLLWTPYPEGALSVANRLKAPLTDGYMFGTDRMGRDVLSQVMAGARNSLFVSVISTLIALVPGVLLGLAAASARGLPQILLSRVADVGVALPGVLVALVVATAIGAGNLASIIAIVVWFVPLVARVTIGPARQILAREFVEASYSYGRGRWFVLFRHVLPNIGPLIIVQGSVMFASAILIEASLSYLGVGAQRPTPSWGRLLNEALPLIDKAPSLMIFPGAAIMISVLGFNLLGDGLRTMLDPQQQSGSARIA